MNREDLASLRAAHAELTRLLVQMETETARSAPDMASLATARLQLTRASRRRSDLIAGFADSVGVLLSDDLKIQLDSVRADLQAARLNSAQHIGARTTKSIQADWKGYQDASRTLRSAMRTQIEREARLLRAIAGRPLDSAPGNHRL